MFQEKFLYVNFNIFPLTLFWKKLSSFWLFIIDYDKSLLPMARKKSCKYFKKQFLSLWNDRISRKLLLLTCCHQNPMNIKWRRDDLITNGVHNCHSSSKPNQIFWNFRMQSQIVVSFVIQTILVFWVTYFTQFFLNTVIIWLSFCKSFTELNYTIYLDMYLCIYLYI